MGRTVRRPDRPRPTRVSTATEPAPRHSDARPNPTTPRPDPTRVSTPTGPAPRHSDARPNPTTPRPDPTRVSTATQSAPQHSDGHPDPATPSHPSADSTHDRRASGRSEGVAERDVLVGRRLSGQS